MTRLEWVTPAIIGAITGATATVVVGFTQSLWVLGSSAERMAQQRSDAAVMAALVPICVSQSKTDPESLVKVARLDAITSPYERRDFVMKAGWATMPAERQPDGPLAVACAEVLLKASQPQ
ncbi:MAG: hypothetical protein ACKVOI_20710 [Dongiaceae bacterium]